MNKDPQGGYKMGASMNDRMSHKKAKLNAGYNPISNTILPGWFVLIVYLIEEKVDKIKFCSFNIIFTIY